MVYLKGSTSRYKMSKDNTHFLVLDMKPNSKKEAGRIIRKYKDQTRAFKFLGIANRNANRKGTHV